MTLSTTLAAYIGVTIECLWLWDAASEEPGRSKSRLGPRYSTAQMAIATTLIVGAILIAISEWVGQTPVTVFLDEQLQFLLMGVAMFFILIVGAVGGWLVPRVNEYNIVSVLAVVTLNTVAGYSATYPVPVGVLVCLTIGMVAMLVLRRSPPRVGGKVMLYVIYLGALVGLTLQGDVLRLAGKGDLTIPEAFVFGSAFSFLSLHTLFGVRFLVVASSFVLPANRRYARPLMRRLFRNDQVAALPFVLVVAGVLALVLLNRQLGVFPPDSFTSVAAILCTQLFFRPVVDAEAV